MTQLANLQLLFQGHVVSGDEQAITAFVGNETASAADRLGIYFNAYRMRLLQILREDFPGLCSIMSADAFDALGLRYIDQHPSQHPSVRQFGRYLAEFLAADHDAIEQPYLAEMARLEWARGFAFDAANADVLTVEELGALPGQDWPALKVQFHPTLQRLRFAWNVGPMWRAINAEEPIPPPARFEQPESWAVWRREVTVYRRSLSEIEACAMDAFTAGKDFAAVCEVLCERLDPQEVPPAMAGMLNQWVIEGLVTK